METLSVVCEIIMIALFGLSWPLNIMRAYKARTAKGTSLLFTLFVLIGYVFGIVGKIVANSWTPLRVFAFVFYCINLTMLITALLIYFRNKKLDKQNEIK